MSNASVEKQLQEFLAWEQKQRAEGMTLEKLHEKQDAVLDIVRKNTKEVLALKHRVDVHGRAIKTLQHQVEKLTQHTPQVPDWQPDPNEITGVHAVRELRRAHEELEKEWDAEQQRKRDESTWWRRQGWIWAFAVVTLIVGATISGCVTYVIHRLERAEASEKR